MAPRLYLAPAERPLVLCVDEESRIQGLDRTVPLLPTHPRPNRAAHARLRASRHNQPVRCLEHQTGALIGQTQRRRRSVELRRFLDTIEQNVPPELDIHLILDNYGAHKTQLIRDWLGERPRFHLHFTPTSASWLNHLAQNRRSNPRLRRMILYSGFGDSKLAQPTSLF